MAIRRAVFANKYKHCNSSLKSCLLLLFKTVIDQSWLFVVRRILSIHASRLNFPVSENSLSKGTYNFLILFVSFTWKNISLKVGLGECGPCSIKDVSGCVG